MGVQPQSSTVCKCQAVILPSPSEEDTVVKTIDLEPLVRLAVLQPLQLQLKMRKKSRRRMMPLFKPLKLLFNKKKRYHSRLLAQLPVPSPLSSTADNHQVANPTSPLAEC